VGVSALLTASTVAYTALRIAGTIYMIWLGARLLLGALRKSDLASTVTQRAAVPSGALRS